MKLLLKLLPLMCAALVTSLCIASCSSDNDEPKNPGNGDFDFYAVPYGDLYGSWIIESFKDEETGAVTTINKDITIGQFTPKPSDRVIDYPYYQGWAQSFEDLISYSLDGDKRSSFAIMSLFNKKNQSLNSTVVFSIEFSLVSLKNDMLFTETFVLSDLHLSGNRLIVDSAAYGYVFDGTVTVNHGTITLKKL